MLLLRVYHPHVDDIHVVSAITAYLPSALQAKIFEFDFVKTTGMDAFGIEYVDDLKNGRQWKGLGPVKKAEIRACIRSRAKQALQAQGYDVTL